VKSVLHSLLVWFVLLAVPFQGIASATTLPCASRAPGAPHAQAAMPAAGKSPGDDHCVHGHASTKVATGHDGHAKCGACAACCAGAAIAAGLPAPPVAAGVVAVTPAPDAGYLPSVDPVLPERPPRPALA
jgi:hypothetical protein